MAFQRATSELHRTPLRTIADAAKSVHLRAYCRRSRFSSRLPPYPAVSCRSFEAPRFDLRSDWPAGTAVLEFCELTSSAMQIARYFTIFLAETFGVSSLLSPPKRGNGSTASRQLSEVKHQHRFNFYGPLSSLFLLLLVSPSLRSRGLFPPQANCPLCVQCCPCAFGAFFGCGHDVTSPFRLTSRDVTCYATGFVPDRR